MKTLLFWMRAKFGSKLCCPSLKSKRSFGWSVLIVVALASIEAFAELKSDPLSLKSPVDPNTAITFKDFQEFKIVIYGGAIYVLVSVTKNLGMLLLNIFNKKGKKMEETLEGLVEDFNKFKGEIREDLREIKTEMKNRPTKDEVIRQIYDR